MTTTNHDAAMRRSSDFCECDEYVGEKIPYFNCTQCVVCWRPSYEEVMQFVTAAKLARQPAGRIQQHRSK